MKSFKELLWEKIEKEGYVEYSSLVSFAGEEGFKISTMDRRMRELCNEFQIEPVEKKSKRGSMYIAAYQTKENKRFIEMNRETCPDCNFFHDSRYTLCPQPSILSNFPAAFKEKEQKEVKHTSSLF